MKRVTKYEAISYVIGLSIISIELLITRYLAPYFGSSILSFTNAISVVLIGLAIGNYIAGKMIDRPEVNRDELLIKMIGLVILNIVAIMLLDKFVFEFVSNAGILSNNLGSIFTTIALYLPMFSLLGAASVILTSQNINSLDTIGDNYGRIYLASTLGGVTGSYLTILLLTNFRLDHILLGYCLLLTALVVLLKKSLPKVLPIVIGLGFLISPNVSSILAFNTNYSYYYINDTIMDNREVRLLQNSTSNLTQAAIDKNSSSSFFDYLEVFTEALESRKSEDIALLGGSILSWPNSIRDKEARMDIVEIDQGLEKPAIELFGYIGNEKQNLYYEDARKFMEKTEKKYQGIFIDAFSDKYVPEHLITEEAIGIYSDKLTDDGYIVMNIIADDYRDSRILSLIYNTYKKYFDNIELYAQNESMTKGNYIMHISKTSESFNTSIYTKLMFESNTTDTLSDQYNPINILLSAK